MKTAIIGYPRVGTLRELKFASEKYFEGVLSKAELQDTAALLRKTHWQTQYPAYYRKKKNHLMV